MSSFNQTSVTCQQRGLEQPFTTWQSLNATLNRKEKDELLNGTLSNHPTFAAWAATVGRNCCTSNSAAVGFTSTPVSRSISITS